MRGFLASKLEISVSRSWIIAFGLPVLPELNRTRPAWFCLKRFSIIACFLSFVSRNSRLGNLELGNLELGNSRISAFIFISAMLSFSAVSLHSTSGTMIFLFS